MAEEVKFDPGLFLDADAVLFQGGEPIYASAALLPVVSPDVAWQGILDLHWQSIGFPVDGLSSALDLGPQEAFGQWSNAVLGALGQVAATDALAGNRLLGSMNDHILMNGGLHGMEAPFLGAYMSASRLGEITDEMDQASAYLDQFGLPNVLGGGAARTAVLNPATRQVGFADLDSLQRTVGQAAGGDLAPMATRLLAGLMDQTITSSTPSSGSSEPTFGSVLGGTASGVATGALIGNALLPGVGGVIGGIVGGVVSFFGSIFGGGSSDSPPQAAREVASGERVAVAPPAVVVNTTNNYTININLGGAATEGHAPPPPPPGPAPGEQRQCPVPSPTHCPLEDDGTLSPDFRMPFWDDVIYAPSMLPTGPGVDYLQTTYNVDVLRIAEVPIVDSAASLDDGGFLENVLLLVEKTPTDPGKTTVKVPARVTDERNAHLQTLVARATVMRVVSAAQFPPETPISTLLPLLSRDRETTGRDTP